MNVKVDKMLHIGYLIPKLGDLEGIAWRWQLLQKYNQKKFKVFAYVDDPAVEKTFSAMFNHVVVRTVADMGLDVRIQVIRADKIDILVDIAGLKQQGFLDIFKRKPAKIQACFIGEFNSTGLKAVDYLFTDKYCDPVNQKADYFSEQLIYLPQTNFCYDGAGKAAVIKKSPFKKNNYITFAGLHHFTSLRDDFLRLWGEILTAVPNSRLLLKSRIFGSGYGCQETRFRLGRLGFPVERLAFVAANITNAALYEKIDIVLGTYPKQSGYGIAEALYHGVPVMTLTGSRHSVRIGYSVLKNVGLEECIAFSAADYVDKTVALANNSYRLMHLRKSLTERMEKSPLMDERRFVGNVERAYESIWQRPITQEKAEALKKDIYSLLLTIRDGLSYARENIAVEGKEAVVGQVLADLAVAFENIQMAVLGNLPLEINKEMVNAVKKRVVGFVKAYHAGRYDACKQALADGLIKGIDTLAAELNNTGKSSS